MIFRTTFSTAFDGFGMIDGHVVLTLPFTTLLGLCVEQSVTKVMNAPVIQDQTCSMGKDQNHSKGKKQAKNLGALVEVTVRPECLIAVIGNVIVMNQT